MSSLVSLKVAVHGGCRTAIRDRITDVGSDIAEAQRSAQSDTKSSAGDKHEASRAMAQQEVEKQLAALANLRRMSVALERIDPAVEHRMVGEGALVRLDSGLFYIAVGLGRVSITGVDVHVISAEAPLAQLLRNKAVGGTATFNGRTHTVLEIA